MKFLCWIACLILLLQTATRAEPAATQSALTSKPAEKDGLQVTLTLPKATLAAGDHPTFTVTFKNISKKPYQLHDAAWFWAWKVDFAGPEGALWRVRLTAKLQREMPASTTLKPGETFDVVVDLNKNPGLFDFAYEGEQAESVPPVKTLPAGKYSLTAEISLGEGPAKSDSGFWTGTLKTEPVMFEISEKPAAAK